MILNKYNEYSIIDSQVRSGVPPAVAYSQQFETGCKQTKEECLLTLLLSELQLIRRQTMQDTCQGLTNRSWTMSINQIVSRYYFELFHKFIYLFLIAGSFTSIRLTESKRYRSD